MATPVERVREVSASKSDDYFYDDTVLYYVNKSKEKIVSYLISREINGRRSLRGLDELRTSQETSVNGITFTQQNSYYVADINAPNDLKQFSYLTFTDSPMREINQSNLIQLEFGNMIPTDNESYYLAKTNKFQLFLPEDYSSTSNAVNIYYIKNPTELTLTDNFSEIPSQLENAVIYNAAFLLVNQESIKDQTTQADRFKKEYQEELQANLY